MGSRSWSTFISEMQLPEQFDPERPLGVSRTGLVFDRLGSVLGPENNMYTSDLSLQICDEICG